MLGSLSPKHFLLVFSKSVISKVYVLYMNQSTEVKTLVFLQEFISLITFCVSFLETLTKLCENTDLKNFDKSCMH